MTEHREGEVQEIADSEQPEPVEQAGAVQPDQQEALATQSHEAAGPTPEQILLIELTVAIVRYPEAPANYVLRAELYIAEGRLDLAAEDFRRALSLADPLAQSANWGYINEALADRAREGLRACE